LCPAGRRQGQDQPSEYWQGCVFHTAVTAKVKAAGQQTFYEDAVA
jgi:hypothetical protein